MKSNDAVKEEDYFLMWTKVECHTAQQLKLVSLQLHITTVGLNKYIHGNLNSLYSDFTFFLILKHFFIGLGF
jgi:hypothetical protein